VRTFLRPNGRTLILPYDQFLEHDARHAEAKSDFANPDYILRLAVEGGYNAVAIHYGLSRRYWTKWEGRIPLIVKVNGKTSIPSEAQALSVHTSYLEDAVRLATEMGSTIIKANLPQEPPAGFIENDKIPKYFRALEAEWAKRPFDETLPERAARVVAAAQGIPVLFSGGSEIGDEDLLWRAEVGVKAGALGFIFGRNMWKRESASALSIARKIQKILDQG